MDIATAVFAAIGGIFPVSETEWINESSKKKLEKKWIYNEERKQVSFYSEFA